MGLNICQRFSRNEGAAALTAAQVRHLATSPAKTALPVGIQRGLMRAQVNYQTTPQTLKNVTETSCGSLKEYFFHF